MVGVERMIRRPRTLAFPVLRRHSRVSPQPSVCRSPCPPPRRPTLSDPHLREVTDGCCPEVAHRRQASDDLCPSPRDRTCLPPASRRRPARTQGSELSSQDPSIPEVTSEKVAPARLEGPRSRFEPEGSHQTAPRRCHRPKSEVTAAGRPRVTTASHRDGRENPRCGTCRRHTRESWPIVVSPNSESEPALRREPVVASQHPLRI